MKRNEIKSSQHFDENSLATSNKNTELVHFYMLLFSFWILRISIQAEGKQTYTKIVEGMIVMVLSMLPCVPDNFVP